MTAIGPSRLHRIFYQPVHEIATTGEFSAGGSMHPAYDMLHPLWGGKVDVDRRNHAGVNGVYAIVIANDTNFEISVDTKSVPPGGIMTQPPSDIIPGREKFGSRHTFGLCAYLWRWNEYSGDYAEFSINFKGDHAPAKPFVYKVAETGSLHTKQQNPEMEIIVGNTPGGDNDTRPVRIDTLLFHQPWKGGTS